ncbi:neural Wiskott-Aldrich syndrome protein-like, partial [Pollicipes pollicipes]|uniref:neural Wiskott-Aldrich syndrome protein-like n=1 Tax=Pollicipes pollicipes TaxID=41117 RepID=UPI0018855D31
MDPPSEFTAESVRDYILSRGGKVTNHELVKHFKPFLTDPVLKDHARAQFKEFVNTLASIKLEDGEKYLVLKKKYRSGLLAEVLSDVGSEYSYVSHSTSSSTPDPPDLGLPVPRAPPPYRPPPPPTAGYGPPFPGPAPYQPPAAYSPGYRAVAAPGPERSPALDEYYHVAESRPLRADPQPLGLPSALEEERQKKISVKEQTQKFNRIASESQLLLPKQNNKRRDRADKLPVDDDDSLSTTTFEGVNKEWILISSSCKYMEIVRMLKDNPKLAKHK